MALPDPASPRCLFSSPARCHERPLRLCLVAAMAVCLWQLSHGVRSAWYEYHGFHGARTHPSRPSSAVAHGLRDVAFPGDAGASIRGGICLRGPALPWCWPAAPKRIGVRCGRTPSYIGVLETARDPRGKLLVLERTNRQSLDPARRIPGCRHRLRPALARWLSRHSPPLQPRQQRSEARAEPARAVSRRSLR